MFHFYFSFPSSTSEFLKLFSSKKFENKFVGEILIIVDFDFIGKFSEWFFNGFLAHSVNSTYGDKSDKLEFIFRFPGITVSCVFTEILHGSNKDSAPTNLRKINLKK